MRGERRSGTFVVIEGPDASGKQTQAYRIAEWLRDKGYSGIGEEAQRRILERMPGRYPDPENEERVDDSIEDGVWHLSFPTYSQTPGGRVVEAYLDGEFGGRGSIDMELIVDIYAADRKQFKELIAEFISEGGIIVCDRYREANLIHQLVGFEDDWEEKKKYIKSVDADLPDADKVFYLDISPEEALRRMDGKDKDIHELDDSYMQKSNANGLKVARSEDWCVIDGERSLDEVEESLRKRILRFVKQ